MLTIILASERKRPNDRIVGATDQVPRWVAALARF